MTDAHKVQPLANALRQWVDASTWPHSTTELGNPAADVLRAAIIQATKAETIEWLASLAERYGFTPPENTA